MSEPSGPYRCLVRVEDREGVRYEFQDATPEQAHAYVMNDPAWKSAANHVPLSLSAKLRRFFFGER